MLGERVDDDVVPFPFCDQYNTGLEYASQLPHGVPTQIVLRGDPNSNALMAFWLVEGRVHAWMHVTVWDTIDDVRTLISSRSRVDPRHLADPEHPLLGSDPIP